MAYVVNPQDINAPSDNIGAFTAAAEIRSIKARVITAFTNIAQTLLDANAYTDAEIAKVTLELDTVRADILALYQQDITEANARIAGDSALSTKINTDVAAEALARTNADNLLQSNINAEALARDAADDTLQANINSEAASRLQGDNTLQTAITSEATARAAADTSLASQITTEVSAEATLRQQADSATLAAANSYTDAEITERTLYIPDGALTFSARAKRITNLADAQDPYDAVSLAKVQQLVQVYASITFYDYGFIFETFISYSPDYGFIVDSPDTFLDYGYTFV